MSVNIDTLNRGVYYPHHSNVSTPLWACYAHGSSSAPNAMNPKTTSLPPRKNPGVQPELQCLYRRRGVVENLIRAMEDYIRHGPGSRMKVKKVA